MTGSGMDGGVTVAIARAEGDPGVDIIDPIERRRCTLLTASAVRPQQTNTDAFHFPVETAVEITTTGIRAPFTGHAYVREDGTEVRAEVINGFEGTFPPAEYSIELAGLIKIYLEFEGGFSATHSSNAVEFEFDEPSVVNIGSRSPHTRPATTITTTEEPRDLLAAISTFGSALKTLSPERSFPTLRGHPPALERGDALSIPSQLDAPVHDVWIEVPPRYEYIYPIVPLAYYLGVRAEPGHMPRIVGPDIDYDLEHPLGVDRGIQEVLQRVFLLDCVIRTEGYYPVDLYERKQVEDRLNLEFADLYDASMAERLEVYLDIPYAVVEDIIPDWRLAAHVEASAESIPMLPYLANDLAVITMANPEPVPQASVSPGASGFTRGSSTETRGGSTATMNFVRPQGGPQAMETAWVSEGTPVEATKAVPAAYQNRFGRTPQDESISIAVVCNSADMDEERAVVDDVYGRHESMPFDVTVEQGLRTDELADLLGRDFNFVHYIGHIDEDGFRCSDGRLDFTGVDDIAPEAFFLNACQSYDQGLALIEGGAIGGIVTLNDVVNHGAVRIGQAVARLLNNGFPLRAALDIASDLSVIGRQYVIVGDGTLSIVQPPGGTPQSYRIESTPSGYDLQIRGFGSPPGMGCMHMPFAPGNSQHYLAEGTSRNFLVDTQSLTEFLSLENVPVEFEDGLHWSYDLRFQLI